ncbi:MAG: hypothetical protein EOO81_01010 [Oxalobacteraceae bacterium]|nr:MAG: hypothetical protein EOO81_01010 [Oxalobacteraceae bacterium]
MALKTVSALEQRRVDQAIFLLLHFCKTKVSCLLFEWQVGSKIDQKNGGALFALAYFKNFESYHTFLFSKGAGMKWLSFRWNKFRLGFLLFVVIGLLVFRYWPEDVLHQTAEQMEAQKCVEKARLEQNLKWRDLTMRSCY